MLIGEGGYAEGAVTLTSDSWKRVTDVSLRLTRIGRTMGGMGEFRQRLAWRRYQRGVRTIPVIVALSIFVWVVAGAGYFWPGFVIAWAAVAMGFRAMRAMAVGPPAELD